VNVTSLPSVDGRPPRDQFGCNRCTAEP